MMMRQAGFSLIELIAVMAIMGILLTIGTLGFNSMTRKYAIDNQTRGLYTDLMELRVKSMYKKKSHYVSLAEGVFIFYSSGTRDQPRGEVNRRIMKYPVTWSNKTSTLIEFDSHGLTTDQRSICVSQNETTPVVDALVLSTARLNMGKRRAGRDCGSDYIDIK